MKTCVDSTVNAVNAVRTRSTTTTTSTTTATITIPKSFKSPATQNPHHDPSGKVSQTSFSYDASNVLRYRCSSKTLTSNHDADQNDKTTVKEQTSDPIMTSNMAFKPFPLASQSLAKSSQLLNELSSSPESQSCKAKLKLLPIKMNTATAATTVTIVTTVNKFSSNENTAIIKDFDSLLSSAPSSSSTLSTSPLSQIDSNSGSTTSSVINTPLSVRNGHAFKCNVNAKEILPENYRQKGDKEAENEDRGEHNNCHLKSFRENSKLSLVLSTDGGAKEVAAIIPTSTPTPTPTKTIATTTTTSFISTPETPSLSLRSCCSTSSMSLANDVNDDNIGIQATSNLNNSGDLATPMTTSSTTTSSPSNAISRMKSSSISGLLDSELLQWQDMPQYLQFNPYVLKGYRPLQTFKGCLFSLFYWHNETINILTHAIPIVYILAIVPGLMPWESGYRFLSFCHVFGSVAPWCGSFVYHLFMNIERGEKAYYTLLKLDMVGIWVTQSFGALPLVTATTYCFSQKWKWFIIASYCAMSLWGLYKALTASSPWQRRLCFALPFTMRSILTFLRTLGTVGGNHVALPHVYLQDAVSLVGGAIGAMRIPEKWFPGFVDFYLNSHNIMHVLVVVAVYSMHKATIKDFEWMSTTTCNGSSAAIGIGFGVGVDVASTDGIVSDSLMSDNIIANLTTMNVNIDL